MAEWKGNNSRRTLGLIKAIKIFSLNLWFIFGAQLFLAEQSFSQDLDTSKNQYQTTGVVDQLPVFYEKLADRLTFPMSWLSGNFPDFDEWRLLARERLRECLLYDPPEVPFDPIVIGEEDRGSYIAKRMVLNISADSRILTYLLQPKGEGPFPAALLLHDHGARFDIGKEKVVRPFDESPERINSSNAWVVEHYGGRYIGDELSQAGYICFVIDALNWGDRGGGGYAGQQALSSNLLHLGASLAGVIAYEDIRSVEFLTSLPRVDTARVAALGLSMGSFRAFQIAALSEKIKASLSICWMAPIKDLIVPGQNKAGGNSAYTMLHPGVFKYLDHMDIAGIACPNPMLFYHGRYDKLFPIPGVNRAYEKLHDIWSSQHADSKLVTKIWDVKHEFSRDMQEEAFQWLHRQFRE